MLLRRACAYLARHLKDMVLRRSLFTGVVYLALRKNSAQVEYLSTRALNLIRRRFRNIMAHCCARDVDVFADDLGCRRQTQRFAIYQVHSAHFVVCFPRWFLLPCPQMHNMCLLMYKQCVPPACHQRMQARFSRTGLRDMGWVTCSRGCVMPLPLLHTRGVTGQAYRPFHSHDRGSCLKKGHAVCARFPSSQTI